jgi:hypothetical protein
MNSWLLLRAMIGKELRMLLRERNQVLGLVVPIAACAISISVAGWYCRELPPAVAQALAGGASPAGEIESRNAIIGLRWAGIGLGSAIAMFLAVGYLVPTILASFAGEKENRTLEVVLASSVPDARLFLLKCVSVLLPMLTMGYLFLLLVAGLSAFWFHGVLRQLPVALIGYAVLAGPPVMLLLGAAFTGLGAAISVRADTLKGAGQVLGGVLMLIFFAGPYGIPLLMRYPPAKHFLTVWGQAWLNLPFAAQYAMVLAVLAIPAAILLAIGLVLFQRDRMLT